MAILNDDELKYVKKNINRLKNAIELFSYTDFQSDILAESALEGWKKELAKLENEVSQYKAGK